MRTNVIQFPQLVSREEAARILGIRPQTLAVWASNGRYRLPFVKIGRRAMYRLADIDAFIKDNVVERGVA